MPEKLREGEDYYIGEDGLLVMTEAYLRRRGTCCENGCRHCPYGFGTREEPASKPGVRPRPPARDPWHR